MRYLRFHLAVLLLALAGLLGPMGARAAHATCYASTVPTAVDYPVAPGTTCRNANQATGDPGNFYDSYTTIPNDYSILYFDAKQPACAAAARTRLEQKLQNNLNYASGGGKVCGPRRDIAGQLPTTNPFQAHLIGGAVAAIFATAVVLADAGYPVNDALLFGVEQQHQGIPSPQDPRCGAVSLQVDPALCPSGGCVNSCMDDYSVTAAGFGWVSAYERKVGRTMSSSSWASLARGQINLALAPWSQSGSVCFYRKGTTPGRCDATKAEVQANLGNVIGADHNQENPAYGFGLMTSIATACEGLKRASSPCTFTADQKWTAQQLLIHAQQRTYYDTTAHDYRFTPWCRNFRNGSSVGCWDPLFGPLELPGYLPTLFPLLRFYDATGMTPYPLSTVVNNSWGYHPAYQFTEYREPRFRWARDEFWGPLRKLFYEELSYLTWPTAAARAFSYWVQPAELAGFGSPGSLVVAGGSTRSGASYPVTMYWRNITTGSGWNLVSYQPTPDPNGNPKDTWYNAVPAPTNPFHSYEVAVQHLGGPWNYCTYTGSNSIVWCTQSNATPPWP